MIRAISRGEDPGRSGFFVLLLYLVIFSGISFFYIYRKKTL
jgi:preprotein translocase subunit YajC